MNDNIPLKENNTNNTITKIKNYYTKFWKNNKEKILVIGGIVVTAIGTALVIDHINQRKFAKIILYLHNQNKIKDKRIEILENMCLEKEKFFKKFISDGTRRGDPECARQLAYRRQYFVDLQKKRAE